MHLTTHYYSASKVFSPLLLEVTNQLPMRLFCSAAFDKVILKLIRSEEAFNRYPQYIFHEYNFYIEFLYGIFIIFYKRCLGEQSFKLLLTTKVELRNLGIQEQARIFLLIMCKYFFF